MKGKLIPGCQPRDPATIIRNQSGFNDSVYACSKFPNRMDLYPSIIMTLVRGQGLATHALYCSCNVPQSVSKYRPNPRISHILLKQH
jgi:hypothetical protein